MESYPFNKLTEYFVRKNHIDVEKQYEIASVPAKSLICPERFDLMAKWIYIDALEKGIDMTFATKIYRDSINAFSCGTFTEPGTDLKNTFDIYLNQFNEIIQDIKNNGFDSEKSLVPVGADDVICDGAHRVAAAAYYNRNVTIIRFPQLSRNFNYDYFRSFLMSDINMGYMAMKYSEIMPNCYFACVWPKAGRKKLKDVTAFVKTVGKIIYEQDVYLTYNGICNFMAQIYGHQAWTGNIDNHFSGVKGKALACYNAKNPVHTYLFTCLDINKVLELKKEIRAMFNLENHSVHIGDNSEETLMMARLLYNPNSVQVLNNADMFKYSMVFNKMKELKTLVSDNHKEVERFIIDSSSVLEICGLRRARDVDYLTDYVAEKSLLENASVDNHESQLPFHSISVKDMLCNPENHFYFNGMKFLSVDRLVEMKKKRNEPKDKKDVKLLKSLKKHFDKIPVQYRYFTMERLNHDLIKYNMYGLGNESYGWLKWNLFKHKLGSSLPFLKYPYRIALKVRGLLKLSSIPSIVRRGGGI